MSGVVPTTPPIDPDDNDDQPKVWQIEDVVGRERQKLNEGDAVARRRMRLMYSRQADALLDDLVMVTRMIDTARANGTEVNPDWLRRQQRYIDLIAQADARFRQVSDDGLGILEQTQLEASERGTTAGQDLLKAAGIDVEFGQSINAPASERLTMALDPDSPLRELMDGYGTMSRDILVDELMSGMGRGASAGAIIANTRRRLNGQVIPRLETLVRTEMMRAYRGALFDQYADHVSQWEWMAAQQMRTCKACLAMDGKRFPMTVRFMPSHVNCRCIPTPVPEMLDEMLGGRAETGAEWLARQPDADQRAYLGAGYGPYKAGELELDDYIGFSSSPKWGESIRAKSTKQAIYDRERRGQSEDPVARLLNEGEGS